MQNFLKSYIEMEKLTIITFSDIETRKKTRQKPEKKFPEHKGPISNKIC